MRFFISMIFAVGVLAAAVPAPVAAQRFEICVEDPETTAIECPVTKPKKLKK